jgi:hypothetical protein
MKLPVLLDQPTPKLRAYRRETVIAEKFQAIVMLGRANRLMKDFYDIWLWKQQWAAFVQDVAVQPGEPANVVDDLSDFLMPHAAKAREIAAGANR